MYQCWLVIHETFWFFAYVNFKRHIQIIRASSGGRLKLVIGTSILSFLDHAFAIDDFMENVLNEMDSWRCVDVEGVLHEHCLCLDSIHESDDVNMHKMFDMAISHMSLF